MPSERELDEAVVRAVKAHFPGVRSVQFPSLRKDGGNDVDAILRTRRGVIVVEMPHNHAPMPNQQGDPADFPH